MMTPEQQAKIHEFAGTWRAGEKCDRNESIELDGKLWCLNAHTWLPKNHDIPMPVLEGDYADMVEAKCRRRLIGEGYAILYDYNNTVLIEKGAARTRGITFLYAVLAYLEREGK